ncbi:MAG: response regulator [Limisphaerales bacterium]
MSALLERDGYRTQGFQSPVAALSAVVAATPKPSLLITDFAMPEMDGVLLMRRCKQICPGLRAIILSGNVSADLLQECGMGPDLVLEKPVSLMRLAAAVEALIGRVPQA